MAKAAMLMEWGGVHVGSHLLVPTLAALALVYFLVIQPRLRMKRRSVTDAEADLNAWWHAQHSRYNWLLILAIVVSFFMLVGVASTFGEDLPCFGIGGFNIGTWVLLLPVLYGAASGWYFFCEFLERLIRPSDPKVFGHRMLRAGLIFWLLVFFLPVIVTTTAAVLNLPCMTKPS
jgi:hypothetical protein